MAKKKRSADDLDAELAALEAELAALEGKKPAPKAAPPAAQPSPPPAPLEEKKRLRFPLGRKKSAQDEASPKPEPRETQEGHFPLIPEPDPNAPPEPVARAPSSAPRPLPSVTDPSLWRQEGGAWIRTVPGEPRVVRRVLDEDGNVVREEPASKRDVDEAAGVKAERAVGKLLGRFRK